MKQNLFSRDFTMVLAGQVVSLFGNAVIRFALPLYLLNQTGSPALLGSVTACALLPSVLHSPVGGVVADRVNKRNVMVALDFFTALVVLAFLLRMEGEGLVLPLTVTLMLLYGIAGAYQPSVQASIPALVSQENLLAANSFINVVSSFSALLGPALGGLLYSAYGLKPVLWICAGCFFASAVMETFIRIPFEKQEAQGKVWEIVKADFTESIGFIRRKKPVIGKAMWMACGINLFLASALLVGVPYLITETLGFEEAQANRLCGIAQGVMAAGGLTGGICTGIFAGRMKLQKTGNLAVAAACSLFPVGASLFFFSSGFLNYSVLTFCCFVIMILSTVLSVRIVSFVQAETPERLVGKVMALVLTVSMCAQPLGNALYGLLFERFRGFEYVVVLLAGGASLLIAAGTKRVFRAL